MTASPLARPAQPRANDLPPELSAYIDAAIARATMRRPVVPVVGEAGPDAPLRLPRLHVSKKRTRILSVSDLVLVSLFVGLLLAGWVSLLIGLEVAQSGERAAGLCLPRAQSSAKAAFDHGACGHLPRQG